MRSMLTRMPMNPDVSVLLAGLYRVGLAKILDLYYEDLYTLPNKQSSSGLVSEISKLSKSKRSSSSLQMLSITFAGGCFLVAIDYQMRPQLHFSIPSFMQIMWNSGSEILDFHSYAFQDKMVSSSLNF
ncbi:uncharacterized protein LOC131227262 isoform X2 [Magnolia sinica]|uniref:uncharacterized protein LOC131227262 isoform X2 n=1 Tax=Magnolia sinica TaxID=86752 RepID=UPI00265855DC|nr:uncharacterized protein LOC131227262 isoform X2 [Magnolia sinica]